MVKEKIEKSYFRFLGKSMFLHVTYYFLLTFSQWHLVDLGVQIHL